MQQSLFGTVINSNPKSEQLTDLNTPLSEAVFTVVDLETTGLNAKKNAITEITAIQFQNGEEVDKYTTLVKPFEEIPPEVESITGISNAMVATAPLLVLALSDLCRFVGNQPIMVGHNVSFDLNFIREKLQTADLSNFLERFNPGSSLCTKVLAQKACPGLPSYEGVVVANHCGIYNANPHRAEYDVRMSAGILFVLIKRLQQENPAIQTVGDLIAYQGILSL